MVIGPSGRYFEYMVNPLIPQLRTDKNGKLVTRHVKTAVSPSSVKVVPAPSVARHFRVPPRDVAKPRRAGTTKSDMAEAKKIREVFGVSEKEPYNSSVSMSDNEILDYMECGFTANAAIEFKRWGVDTGAARLSPVARFPVRQTVARMRALDLSPEEATKIIRHGMTDQLLDKHLTDNELFGILHDERLNSAKYAERSAGVRALVMGECTRDDYRELGFENVGKYRIPLQAMHREGDVDYPVVRAIIQRAEGEYVSIQQSRYHEGWNQGDYRMDFRGIAALVKKHGPEVLDLKYLGVVRLGMRFGEDMGMFRYMDEFFTKSEGMLLRLEPAQRKDLASMGKGGGSVADFTEILRTAGLAPEQAIHSITNGLTVEKAKEIHLNNQSSALIDGWL